MNKAILMLAGSCLLLVSGCNTRQTTDTMNLEPSPEIIRTMGSSEVTAEGTRVERFSIYSPSMDRQIKAVVVLPPGYDLHPDKTYPVLYTLHGANAPYDTWAQMPRLRAKLKDMPFIYTCFDGDAGSNYIDSPIPIKTARPKDENHDNTKKVSLFTTFFYDEFVPGIDKWYRTDGTKRGVTGFSMGGFGAFHYMLERPDFFNSVSGLSSAYLDTKEMSERRRSWLESTFGEFESNRERYEAVDHYLRFEKQIGKGVQFPPMYSHCGTEDFLLDENRKMHAFLVEKGIPIEYIETPGAHDWKFWHPASVGIADFHWKEFNAN